MRYLFFIIFSAFSGAYSQNVLFKEIKLKPNTNFYNVNKATIIYPIVVTKNTIITKKINEKMREEIIGPDDAKIAIRKALSDLINNGLINLSYKVTFKKNGVLSMSIYSESCEAYCSSWNTYFNFDLKTGEIITIGDIINTSMLDSLRDIIRNDKLKALQDYKKKEAGYLTENEIDSATYNWAIQVVDSYCTSDVQIENFSLTILNIEIIDPCEFPHILKSQEPAYELNYSYKTIKMFLKDEFQHRLLK